MEKGMITISLDQLNTKQLEGIYWILWASPNEPNMEAFKQIGKELKRRKSHYHGNIREPLKD
jgi:hypothetical protein